MCILSQVPPIEVQHLYMSLVCHQNWSSSYLHWSHTASADNVILARREASQTKIKYHEG